MTRLDREESRRQDKFNSFENHTIRDKLTYAECLDQAENCECDEKCETAVPLIKNNDGDWVVHAKKTRYIAGQFHDLGVICLMMLCIVACLVFYMICPRCLFGILVFSACLCPFYHPMNVPLWLAIILLTFSGWSLTTGALSITWNNGM